MGVILYIVYVSVQAISWLSIKAIYIYQPDINGVQIMCLRGLVASFVIFIKVNTDIKRVMWDTIASDQWTNLALRCV